MAHPSLNTLFTVNDVIIPRPPPDSLSNTEPLDTSILIKCLGPSFKYEPERLDLKPSDAPLEHDPHPIEGEWIGVCMYNDVAYQGSFQFIIEPVMAGTITGKGTAYLESVNIDGTFGTTDTGFTDGVVNVSLTVSPTSPTWSTLLCEGQFDPRRETIKGTWSVKYPESRPEDRDADSGVHDGEGGDNDNDGETYDDVSIYESDVDSDDSDDHEKRGDFYIAKVSPDIFRFRHLLDGPSPDPSWTIARKRWAFAIEVVLHQTQSRMGSWNFFKARISERRSWVELRSRKNLEAASRTTRGFLTDQQSDELLHLTRSIPPSTAMIYEELATYLHSRLVYYVYVSELPLPLRLSTNGYLPSFQGHAALCCV